MLSIVVAAVVGVVVVAETAAAVHEVSMVDFAAAAAAAAAEEDEELGGGAEGETGLPERLQRWAIGKIATVEEVVASGGCVGALFCVCVCENWWQS